MCGVAFVRTGANRRNAARWQRSSMPCGNLERSTPRTTSPVTNSPLCSKSERLRTETKDVGGGEQRLLKATEMTKWE